MICNSGGAEGSDLIFENECIKHNVEIIAWSFYSETQKEQTT